MEDVAAGRDAVEVLVGERAEVVVADGADRPRGGGHGGGGCIHGAGLPLLVVGFVGGKPRGFAFRLAGAFETQRKIRGGKLLLSSSFRKLNYFPIFRRQKGLL